MNSNTNALDLIADFPQKLKAPLAGLYKRNAIDDSLLQAVANAAALTKPDMQILPFALGVLHMRHHAVPVIDALRMAREQGRRIRLNWSAKRWAAEHDRLSRFETLKRLTGEAVQYDLSAYDELLPERFSGYLIRSSRRLGAEGLRQRHCVASWHARIQSRRAAIATLFVGRKRVTVELIRREVPEPHLYIGHIRGRFNAIPTKEESTAIYAELGIETYSNTYAAGPANGSTNNYKENLARMVPVLKQLGVGAVTVYFDGSGDSGCIESADFFGAERSQIDPPEAQVTIRESSQRFENGHWVVSTQEVEQSVATAIESIVDDWLSATNVDWYNNDGGYGECEINVAAGTISLDVNVRITESDSAYWQEYDVAELVEEAVLA